MSVLKCTYDSTQNFNAGLPEIANLSRRLMAQLVNPWLRLVFLFCRLGLSAMCLPSARPRAGLPESRRHSLFLFSTFLMCRFGLSSSI
jgi:hypothetical protein